LANKNRIPIIPYGAGSGFEGGINAINVKILGIKKRGKGFLNYFLYFCAVGWHNNRHFQVYE
jgi:hypothetical protein